MRLFIIAVFICMFSSCSAQIQKEQKTTVKQQSQNEVPPPPPSVYNSNSNNPYCSDVIDLILTPNLKLDREPNIASNKLFLTPKNYLTTLISINKSCFCEKTKNDIVRIFGSAHEQTERKHTHANGYEEVLSGVGYNFRITREKGYKSYFFLFDKKDRCVAVIEEEVEVSH